MNKKTKKASKKQTEKRVYKMVASVHTLISVVAIIECLILFIFTTYSWIETNSSLIIQNGPAYNDMAAGQITSLHISDELKYKIDLNADSSDWSDLNKYFSKVNYFEYAKTTSPNGRDFFFPYFNNTHPDTTAFRSGETIDYNTSYLYFDFVLSNMAEGAENYDIFFDDSLPDIFIVNGDYFSDSNGHTNAEYCRALRSAMRISITTQSGTAQPVTSIYSINAGKYRSIPASYYGRIFEDPPVTPTISNITANTAESLNIADYVYELDNGVISADKLFTARKNSETKVSIRIWFEMLDPTYTDLFGDITGNNFDYETNTAYQEMTNAKIGVSFKLKASANDRRALYFDDYTFANTGGHLTDSDPDKSVWFYAYQPYVAATSEHEEHPAEWKAIQLSREPSTGSYTRWSTTETTISMMEDLMNINNRGTATRYQSCFFCYGNYSTKVADYCWPLPSSPLKDSGEYIFNAYSYEPNKSLTTGASQSGVNGRTANPCKVGVGIWQENDSYSTMSLLKLSDMTTAVTSGNYNTSVSGSPNEKFMQAKAIADNHSHYLVYANNKNFGTSFTASAETTVNYSAEESKVIWPKSGVSSNYTYTIGSTQLGTVADTSAVMYYDASEEVFKSYVPSFWLSGDYGTTDRGVSFTYTPSGEFTQSASTQQWYSAAPQSSSDGYVYTALGYTKTYNDNCYLAESSASTNTIFTGIGTWGEVERISFCTDLIDMDLSSAYRYMIGINGYSHSNAAWDYYAMIPDASNMTFYAYVPKDVGKNDSGISFARFASTSTHSSPVCWFANRRSPAQGFNYSTYYPVNRTGTYSETGDAKYTHGYWNVSVLVDGTYENLIYDTLTDGTGTSYPTAYSIGSTTSNNVTTYTIGITTTDTQGSTTTTTTTGATSSKFNYTDRKNYGKLEYSYNYDPENPGNATWTTLADDLSDTYTNRIDRYRFYVPAEGYTNVYWRWTPYAGYTVTDTDPDPDTITAYAATVFIYTHDTSGGVYKLVTEASDATGNVQPQQGQQNQQTPSGSLRRIAEGLAGESAAAPQTEAPAPQTEYSEPDVYYEDYEEPYDGYDYDFEYYEDE